MDFGTAIISLVGLIATVGTVSFGIPQAIKVTRDKTAEGVSRATWWLALAICWPWGAYGYSANDLFLFATNIVAALVAIWVLVACDRSRWALILISTVSASLAGVAALLLSPPQVLVTIATLMLVLSRAPQLVLLFRVQNAKDVSLATWYLSLLTGASWALYGVLRGDPVIYVANGIATAMTVAIVLRLLVLQKSRGNGSEPDSDAASDVDDISGHENPKTEKL